MNPLTGLTVSLLALKLVGLSDMSLIVIAVPAMLQGVLNVFKAVVEVKRRKEVSEALKKFLEDKD